MIFSNNFALGFHFLPECLVGETGETGDDSAFELDMVSTGFLVSGVCFPSDDDPAEFVFVFFEDGLLPAGPDDDADGCFFAAVDLVGGAVTTFLPACLAVVAGFLVFDDDAGFFGAGF